MNKHILWAIIVKINTRWWQLSAAVIRKKQTSFQLFYAVNRTIYITLYNSFCSFFFILLFFHAFCFISVIIIWYFFSLVRCQIWLIPFYSTVRFSYFFSFCSLCISDTAFNWCNLNFNLTTSQKYKIFKFKCSRLLCKWVE